MASISKKKSNKKKPTMTRAKSAPVPKTPKAKPKFEKALIEMMETRGTVYKKFAGENLGQRCVALTMTPERLDKLKGLPGGKKFEMPEGDFGMVSRVLGVDEKSGFVSVNRDEFFSEFAEPKDWSQEDLLQENPRELPYLRGAFMGADFYRKTKRIFAQQIDRGTKVVTICHDGKAETSNIAKADGDYCVMNPMGANEQWIIPQAKFNKLYVLVEAEEAELGDPPENMDEYKAKPGVQIGAIEMSAKLMEKAGWHREGYFIAAWNEPMLCMVNDFLVMPDSDQEEIYRIGRNEFFDTFSKLEPEEQVKQKTKKKVTREPVEAVMAVVPKKKKKANREKEESARVEAVMVAVPKKKKTKKVI